MTNEEVKAAIAEIDAELEQLKAVYPALGWRAMALQDILDPNKRNQSASLSVGRLTDDQRTALKVLLAAAGWSGECKGVVQWTVIRSKVVANG